jgi:hypothetical protein
MLLLPGCVQRCWGQQRMLGVSMAEARLTGCATALAVTWHSPVRCAGVEDAGYPRGLERPELDASLAVITRMAASLQVRGAARAPACVCACLCVVVGGANAVGCGAVPFVECIAQPLHPQLPAQAHTNPRTLAPLHPCTHPSHTHATHPRTPGHSAPGGVRAWRLWPHGGARAHQGGRAGGHEASGQPRGRCGAAHSTLLACLLAVWGKASLQDCAVWAAAAVLTY